MGVPARYIGGWVKEDVGCELRRLNTASFSCIFRLTWVLGVDARRLRI
jgi:hypothetical protein